MISKIFQNALAIKSSAQILLEKALREKIKKKG